MLKLIIILIIAVVCLAEFVSRTGTLLIIIPMILASVALGWSRVSRGAIYEQHPEIYLYIWAIKWALVVDEFYDIGWDFLKGTMLIIPIILASVALVWARIQHSWIYLYIWVIQWALIVYEFYDIGWDSLKLISVYALAEIADWLGEILWQYSVRSRYE